MSLVKECNTNCIKINNNNNNSSSNNKNNDNDHDNTNNVNKDDNKILMNIDDVQEKYLRETTLFFRGIDKPLKYGPNVNTLQDLIKSLYDAFETKYVNIELVNHLMLSYKSNPREWQKFAKWDRYRYTRNLVDEGNGKFNLMILCWGEGHASAIHDHSNSHCFMKIMKGELIETKYEMPSINNNDNNNQNDNIGNSLICYNNLDDKEDYDGIELKEISRKKLELNGVCYINDNIGLHRVENPSHTDGAVSLHLYCPPFNSCSIFQKNSGKPVKCPVTFWSKYGVKQSKESESK